MYYDNSRKISILPKSATPPFCKMYIFDEKIKIYSGYDLFHE